MKFTRHALERMKERGIAIYEVKLVVSKPDSVIKQGDQVKFVKIVEGKAIVVVGRYISGELLIITTFRTSKLSKYLQKP
ncbi:MAG: DUF4258 domain-containing protein [Candidatus Diapherotrites archaeon]|nr:DUF4258 domain-containing protein [Candidatus Diapherotrites archaeon]